jgi:hypothetical protein
MGDTAVKDNRSSSEGGLSRRRRVENLNAVGWELVVLAGGADRFIEQSDYRIDLGGVKSGTPD